MNQTIITIEAIEALERAGVRITSFTHGALYQRLERLRAERRERELVEADFASATAEAEKIAARPRPPPQRTCSPVPSADSDVAIYAMEGAGPPILTDADGTVWRQAPGALSFVPRATWDAATKRIETRADRHVCVFADGWTDIDAAIAKATAEGQAKAGNQYLSVATPDRITLDIVQTAQSSVLRRMARDTRGSTREKIVTLIGQRFGEGLETKGPQAASTVRATHEIMMAGIEQENALAERRARINAQILAEDAAAAKGGAA